MMKNGSPSLLYASLGLQVAQGIGNYMTEKAAYDIERLQQKYRKKIAAVQTAMDLNAQGENAAALQRSLATDALSVQRASLRDEGSAIAGAAAAGVRGASVDLGLLDLQRRGHEAAYAVEDRMKAERTAAGVERRNIRIGGVLGQPRGSRGGPSAASALLGLGARMLDTYNNNLPEAQRLGAKLAE